MTSPTKRTQKVLEKRSKRQLERLLLDVANTKEDEMPHLARHHAEDFDLLPSIFDSAEARRVCNPYTLKTAAKHVRAAWDAKDERHFHWYLWKAISVPVSKSWLEGSDAPPEVESTFEQAIEHLRKNRHRAAHCAHEACLSPYFFKRERATKFCSSECAEQSRREIKAEWWRKNRRGK